MSTHGDARTPLGFPEEQGCFETMRAYDGRVLELEAHLERLWASAHALRLAVGATPVIIRRAVLAAVAQSHHRASLVRVQLVGARAGVQTRVVVEPFQPLPARLFEEGITVVTVPTRKPSVTVIDYQSKASARLGSVLAVLEATQQGGFEGLMLGREGWVTETTISNLFAIDEGMLLTPPCRLGILAGITRQLVIDAARQEHLPVVERPLTRHDCYNADELFLSSTTKELLPVVRLDGRAIGAGKPGLQVRRIHRRLQQLIKERLDGTRHAGTH